jgi:hypothetical protein
MKRSKVVSGLLASVMSGVTPAAEAPPQEPLTVLAMLRLESDLMAQRQAHRLRVARQQKPKPELISIYGVDHRLHATISWGSRTLEFVQGQSRSLTHPAGLWRLHYIKPPCVSLAWGTERHRICLSRVGS